MNHRSKTASLLAIALIAGSGVATAQYTGPSSVANTSQATATSSGYTGPSSVPAMTVKQVMETGKDDQHVRLKGRIVSHDGGHNYTFADETGKLPVEIAAKRFPANQPIGADRLVEITAEIDKGFRKMGLEVEQVSIVAP